MKSFCVELDRKELISLSKYKRILEKSIVRAREIVKDGDAWKSFLDDASYTNKYSFQNQLLIHKERDNVRAVASFDVWSKYFNRWIKKGSKGIPIVRDNQKIEYVFDIGDTERTKYTVRDANIWQYDQAKHSGIFEGLKESYSTGDFNKDVFTEEDRILKMVANDNRLSTGDENGGMHRLMHKSISYMLMKRMGLDADNYFDSQGKLEFSEIELLSSQSIETINEFGTVIKSIYTEITQDIIREINKVNLLGQEYVRNIENSGNLDYNEDEKEIANEPMGAFNISEKREDEKDEGKEESSDDSGREVLRGDVRGRDDIHASRSGDGMGEGGSGLQVGQRDGDSLPSGGNRSGRGTAHWQVRTNEGEVPERAQGRESQRDDDAGNISQTPSRYGGIGEQTAGNDDRTNEGEIRSDGGAKSGRSNEVDTGDELHQDDDRGTDSGGTDLRLNDDEQQLNLFAEETIEAMEDDSIAFSVSENHINNIIKRGTGTENGKLRVMRFFEESSSNKERADFLKEEYGSYGMASRGEQLSSESKGLKISVSNEDEGYKEEKYYTWSEVARRIDGFIKREEYLTDEELVEYNIRKDEIGQSYAYAFSKGIGDSRTSKEDELGEKEVATVSQKPVEIIEDEHVEKVEEQPNNYQITNDNLGNGTPKEKYKSNIAAIRTLKQIENENRLATSEEQEIMSNYVGWGGLAGAFDKSESNWTEEYEELKELLTEEEYKSARASTLNAHFTPPIIIQSMYEAIGNMGFKKGNVLEPSMGIGNFFGLMPEEMKESNLYGVELDDLTGRMAKQLYQSANIIIDGYEKTDLPDNLFDLAIGNVPFGDYKVNDRRYDKNNFLIHDYFFGKTLDKVRAGGVVAFITSKGTLDKENDSVRKYIAERADLVGAIRLPNNAFKANAGTEVTTDIIFLQKRDTLAVEMPDWVNIKENEDGIRMNQYFIEHPEMVLGKMEMVSTQFGYDSACLPDEEINLNDQLKEAIKHLDDVTIETYEQEDELEDIPREEIIPADINVRNHSYTLVDDEIYYRENSIMRKVETKNDREMERIKGLVGIRDAVREVIVLQTDDYSDEAIIESQKKLNTVYDNFQKKYGLINSRANKKLFEEDSSFPLLSSLEITDSNNEFVRKSDIFSKRTIRKQVAIDKVDTASEALTISVNEKAKVDLNYMASLTGKKESELVEDLKGVIYQDFEHNEYVTADEYLSGNIREKLKYVENRIAATKEALEERKDMLNDEQIKKVERDLTVLEENREVLEEVKPKDLVPGDITIRLGSTWVPKEDIRDFIHQTLELPPYKQKYIDVNFSNHNATWNVTGKNTDFGNELAISTYGTSRINAYKIIEETLNLKDVKVMDKVFDHNNNEKRVVNQKETALAQEKQAQLQAKFKEWIWEDGTRRERLVKTYNEKFNAIRPREYDGSHLEFIGMNTEIKFRDHQKDVTARGLYGGNTLMAHVVGAGKTFSCIAIAMESKRLGLANKSLIVVPNHLTEQWGSDFMQLYPSANILVATKKDFQPKNRKKFLGKIATGEYDAVIIGHSQFEKIPLSDERQRNMLEKEIDTVLDGIEQAKRMNNDRFSVKQMEKTKKSLETRLEKLNDQSKKDDVVTFEELGVDKLFVDEAHKYKNLFLYTKMQNVAGVGTSEAKKSTDMYMKCRYMDELTGGKGVVFATGTPISNSMTEMYTMQRYLQYDELERMNLENFDAWASTFGETVTAIELAPEGTGFRQKTRFSKFHNIPELMTMFREVADIQTSDMLDLPTPEPEYTTVVTKPSELQEEMVQRLSERAEDVRNRSVQPNEDNMLKITNDGRKLALDQRLINPNLPDDENSKVSECTRNVFDIWENTKKKRSTQLIFCDLSTPKNDGSFNVYDDIKNKLVVKGVPAEEIEFIHNAKTEKQKDELFEKVRNGDVRVLLGSTEKMGAGTNVQDRLIALHDLDCPWRPSDLEQRMGRIVRQGNQNEKVQIIRYVTENTFDSYSYQLIENKQKFISQIMTSKSPARSADDVDDSALSYAEIKALATGDPKIKEKMDLDVQVGRLKMLESSFYSQKYMQEKRVREIIPERIADMKQRIKGLRKDLSQTEEKTIWNEDKSFSPMKIKDKLYHIKEDAGKAILDTLKKIKNTISEDIGEYRGFKMKLEFDKFNSNYSLYLKNESTYQVNLGNDLFGNIARIDNKIKSIPQALKEQSLELDNIEKQLENAKVELDKPFPQEEELKEKERRLKELDELLSDGDDKPSKKNQNKRSNQEMEIEM